LPHQYQQHGGTGIQKKLGQSSQLFWNVKTIHERNLKNMDIQFR